MKKKWLMHAVIILIIVPAVGSTACSAQFKTVKRATPALKGNTGLPKVDTSKLKPGPIPVKPKENKPADLTPVNDMKYGKPAPPAKAGSIRQIKGLNRAQAPHLKVIDSTHGFGGVYQGTIYPASSKSGKGTRSSINPQPLPPGYSPSQKSKVNRQMINPQPLPPKAKRVNRKPEWRIGQKSHKYAIDKRRAASELCVRKTKIKEKPQSL